MGFGDFMNKVRQWDNRSAQWMMKHFYMLFFEFILVGVFVFFFMNTFKVIDASDHIPKYDAMANLLLAQTTNTSLIVILLLFNSFWMLYIFNSILRLRSVLKNIEYNLTRKRTDRRDDN
ncbi:MAG: hypothetical protein JNN05_05010 [Candidatus Omnitrophica bacterium]|nr:hypothetical protein [Candidatus Omnitrophota bacterium]